MTLNLTIPQQTHTDFRPRITVIGVGGGGTNAVDNMIALNLQGVDFVVANTDAQQLMHSRADRRVQLGPHLTQGLGAGAKPEIGRAAASAGLMLRGDGRGGFTPLPATASGFVVPGQARDLVRVRTRAGLAYVVARNDDRPLLFRPRLPGALAGR